MAYLGKYLSQTRRASIDDIEPFWAGVDESFLSARSLYPAIDAVKSAITRGRSFNFIPDRLRAPDDLSRAPIISPDGSGLTSTIFHMQPASQPRRRGIASLIKNSSGEDFDAVVAWTRLVFPELNDLKVVADPHTGKYLGYLTIGEKGLRIPFQSASDGTLKWLGVVTLIITRGGVYSIEEPENYLHPQMQRFLVELIRDFAYAPTHAGYFIISTHSETIINECLPSELILFEFVDGATRCSRLVNQDTVQTQINETGFGLGYFYASNAVS